jgi:O-phospho-L-seryl-tRNASec:L-selenocysteinyl-tRNA synthase
MNDWSRRIIPLDIEKKLIDLIPENIAERGRITLDSILSPIRDLLHRQRFPETPLTEFQVDLLIRLLASMDTDKDPSSARVGEREGRVVSPYLDRLSGGFNHGVGRSGHLTAAQPKAAGASLMQRLTNNVAMDAIRHLGLSNIHGTIVTPLSTGMTLALVLSYLRQQHGVRHVLYPRIDHDSPRRGIAFAGVSEIQTPTLLEGDAVRADLSELERALSSHENCAILATTTFFPPRESDPVKDIARLAQERDIPLIINNAYGVQSEEIMKQLQSAIDAGRVDAIIQSSDKNFMTPVGGSILVSPEEATVEGIAEVYAGRATAAPILQTLVALLMTGLRGYHDLRMQQHENREFLEGRLRQIAEEVDQRLLDVVNPIACAMTVDGLDPRGLGGRLYNLRVTGPRAVVKGDPGSCIDNYPHSYLVMNAAIGASKNDIEMATIKLYKGLNP